MACFEYLKKFFQSENFRYEEEEGILSFKIQGVNYFAFTNDSPFLQIVIVCNISNKDKTKILEICNELNSDKFVTKFILRGERVWCSYEFNPSEHTSSDEFMAIFSILDKTSDEFLEKMSKL